MFTVNEQKELKKIKKLEKGLRCQFFEKIDELARLQPGTSDYQKTWDQTVKVLKEIDQLLIDQAYLIGPSPIRLYLLRTKAPQGLKSREEINQLIRIGMGR